MTQSLVALLAATRPGVAIDILAPEWTAPLIVRMPQVRQAIPLPLTHGQLGLWVRWRLARALRREGYGEAIIIPNSFKAALIPFWAGIPQRTGYRGEWRQPLLTDCRPLNPKTLPRTVDRMAALSRPLQATLPIPIPEPRLISSPEAGMATLARLGHPATEGRPVAVFCPGAEYGPAKQWPAA
ncbi:MAG: lipopolysaccharide heptosyltransferase II, partial [Magnetococcales bacterium]|nr:lipopolysaccharide heptosyltransferase II [Magnetococcales bacterium]